jgi:hypothetical protein
MFAFRKYPGRVKCRLEEGEGAAEEAAGEGIEGGGPAVEIGEDRIHARWVAEGRDLFAECLGHRPHHRRRDLQVEEEAINSAADAEGLVGVARRACEAHGPVRKIEDVAVPLERLEGFGEPGEERIGLPLAGES